MLKNHEKKFNFLQRTADVMVVLLSLCFAYTLRFEILSGGQEGMAELFIKMSPFLAIISLYSFFKNGLYRSHRFSSRYHEISTVLKANFWAFIGFVILLFFFAPQRISRITMLSYLGISSVFLTLSRMMIRNFLRYLRKKGKNLRYFLLVGNGPQFESYLKTLNKFKDAGIEIVGWSDSQGLAAAHQLKELQGSYPELVEKYQPDTIVIGYGNDQNQKIHQTLKLSHTHLTPIQILPDLSAAFLNNQLIDFAGIPIIAVNNAPFSQLDLLFKRSLDFFASLMGIIIISPLLLSLAVLVKLTSKGPAFYGQERMGLDGKSFTMWKFRSMKINAEDKSGAVWAQKDDPRRTSIGTFLRSTSLDELPQLWNVLLGDMSLVGPRPERPVFVEKFKNDIPAYMLRHKVKAGITGWAQVNGWRGDTSLEKRIECDLFYIRNWSLLLDIKIIFMTLWTGFVNKNAY